VAQKPFKRLGKLERGTLNGPVLFLVQIQNIYIYIYFFDWSINLIYVTPNSTLKIKVAHRENFVNRLDWKNYLEKTLLFIYIYRERGWGEVSSEA
jgi:hypothetical protein